MKNVIRVLFFILGMTVFATVVTYAEGYIAPKAMPKTEIVKPTPKPATPGKLVSKWFDSKGNPLVIFQMYEGDSIRAVYSVMTPDGKILKMPEFVNVSVTGTPLIRITQRGPMGDTIWFTAEKCNCSSELQFSQRPILRTNDTGVFGYYVETDNGFRQVK